MEKRLKSFKEKLPRSLNDFGITPVVVGVVLLVSAILQVDILTKESLAAIDVEVDTDLLFKKTSKKASVLKNIALTGAKAGFKAFVSSLLQIDISAFTGCIVVSRCVCE